MYLSGVDKKSISFINFFIIQYIQQGVIFKMFYIFLLSYVLIKSYNQFRSLISLHDVPHFSFSKGIVPFHSKFVIWMQLNGQVFPGINKLDKYGKLSAESFQYTFTK